MWTVLTLSARNRHYNCNLTFTTQLSTSNPHLNAIYQCKAHYIFNVKFRLPHELYRNVSIINSTIVNACYMHKTKKQTRSLTLEYRTDKLSRNVGKKLPLLAAWYPRRAHISSTSRPKLQIAHIYVEAIPSLIVCGCTACKERRVERVEGSKVVV
jgi:hypothetical protein